MKRIYFGIPVEVIKKRIKNLHLYVLPPEGNVRLTVPKSLSEENIEKFIYEKRNWIEEKQAEIRSRRNPKRDICEKNTVLLFGASYPVVYIPSSGKPKAFFDGKSIILTLSQDAPFGEKEKALNELYRQLLHEKLEKHIPLWENITGLYCNEWRIKNMKTRWGTCNTTDKRIWMNLALAKKNVSYIDYVILHELCHLKYADHSERFTSLMASFMPDWQKRKKALNSDM